MKCNGNCRYCPNCIPKQNTSITKEAKAENEVIEVYDVKKRFGKLIGVKQNEQIKRLN